MKYTTLYKNWIKELSKENEGNSIINNSTKEELEILYKRCTGKNACKNEKK